MSATTRGYTITACVELVTEECADCGVTFAMPQDLRQQFLNNPTRWFWCPSGHKNHYTGPTEAQRAKERAERLERQLANRDETLRSERAAHSITKGQLTKTKNRLSTTEKHIANGVCPCCRRSFVNLQRHMSTKHPDYVTQS